MKLLIVFGTRPEAIKLAPIIKEAHRAGILVETCNTGQHSVMLDQVLELFNIKPDYELHLMQPSQQLGGLTARVLDGVTGVLLESKPNLVLVQGDTTTAFATALASFYCKIPVGHVEAGLRTLDLQSPFPEEAMRQMIGRIASLHFAPTTRNAKNLLDEGISSESIFVTGNTVIDALLDVQQLVRAGKKNEALDIPESLIQELRGNTRMVLITGHRRENFGAAFERVCDAIRELAERHPDTLFIYPVHLNPNVVGPAQRMLGEIANVRLIEPANYYSFVYLMDRSCVILSDSGGVQEEAPSLHKPVFVTRENTERTEIIAAGAAKLVGTDVDVIVKEVSAVLESEALRQKMMVETNPYGDGHSAERILSQVLDRALLAAD